MVKCPRCRAEFAELQRDVENPFFSLKYYTCDKCHHVFKVARVKYPTALSG
jgi:C4-type Zn-finger protein